MNPARYFLRGVAFSALRGGRLSSRYVAVLAGRAIGSFIVSLFLGSRG